MSCSCTELETQHGQGKCKCAHYRRQFPDCQCEHESVSRYSPGPVQDDEVLVRTLFRSQITDQSGRLKPTYFRPEPTSRGFSVDRVSLVGSESLAAAKRTDARYNGYLQFIAARSSDLRAATINDGKRLFCIYDSAIADNTAHADICQNVHIASGEQNRKERMMEFAWRLRYVFCSPQPTPPTSVGTS